MKRIVIMNCITISLIVILSYISTPNNQILANHHLITGFGSVIAFMSVLVVIVSIDAVRGPPTSPSTVTLPILTPH